MVDNAIYLLKLAEGNDIFNDISTTTTKLVNLLDVSQQSVSRVLIMLEKEGYIARVSSTKGVVVKVTDKGIEYLKDKYEKLSKHFKHEKFIFRGTIKKGLGEGKYYISRPTYKTMFMEQLKMNPFDGTLNVEVTEDVVKKIVHNFPYIFIKGFSTKSRTFSSLKCYKCRINNEIDGYIIFVERTSHPDNILEIISEKYVRNEVNNLEIEIEMHS